MQLYVVVYLSGNIYGPWTVEQEAIDWAKDQSINGWWIRPILPIS